MADLIVFAFILYMHNNNNDQSLILVVPGISCIMVLRSA